MKLFKTSIDHRNIGLQTCPSQRTYCPLLNKLSGVELGWAHRLKVYVPQAR